MELQMRKSLTSFAEVLSALDQPGRLLVADLVDGSLVFHVEQHEVEPAGPQSMPVKLDERGEPVYEMIDMPAHDTRKIVAIVASGIVGVDALDGEPRLRPGPYCSTWHVAKRSWMRMAAIWPTKRV